jgi:hypothetical protein
MLLYSTTLIINDTLTQEEFIRLVIQWNQASPHQNNVISDINWSGERNIRYGNDDLWLDIEEYRNMNTIAVRFEKRESDGAVWDTDFIMNFSTMKMTVQLDRGYTEDDVLQNNDYRRVSEERERVVKIMFKEYKTLLPSMRQQLQELGFEITEEGKHYRLTYYGDDRYKTTFSKTGSDWREGKNMASTIIKNMM